MSLNVYIWAEYECLKDINIPSERWGRALPSPIIWLSRLNKWIIQRAKFLQQMSHLDSKLLACSQGTLKKQSSSTLVLVTAPLSGEINQFFLS